jgi:formate dehydrogenase maturation protein FdhE
MQETLNPMICPMCNSRHTNVTSNGRAYRYAMVCNVCQCRWKVFNRKTRFSPIEIIEYKEEL